MRNKLFHRLKQDQFRKKKVFRVRMIKHFKVLHLETVNNPFW